MNVFWYEIMRDYRYNMCIYKGTFIRNPFIQVAQWMLVCRVFSRDDSPNVYAWRELYFLSCVMNDDCINPRSFLATQLYSAATSTEGGITIGGYNYPITQYLGIEPNPEDKLSGSE